METTMQLRLKREQSLQDPGMLLNSKHLNLFPIPYKS